MSDISMLQVKTQVVGIKAINNSIYACLMTQIGERVWSREFGSNVPRLLMEPMDGTTAHLLKVSIYRSLSRWEPRIAVDYASIEVNLQDSGYSIVVPYKILVNNASGNLTTTLRRK